ncbi:hypothetical protein E5288_WYG013747 [Bos mutus]|uniref:Uncharacterized protein n=1 Tax=Bos mutus TaxID=72004 RepID=A0A6B0QSX4_9CETA|nr:hypothetical protein [Bos mutus]
MGQALRVPCFAPKWVSSHKKMEHLDAFYNRELMCSGVVLGSSIFSRAEDDDGVPQSSMSRESVKGQLSSEDLSFPSIAGKPLLSQNFIMPTHISSTSPFQWNTGHFIMNEYYVFKSEDMVVSHAFICLHRLVGRWYNECQGWSVGHYSALNPLRIRKSWYNISKKIRGAANCKSSSEQHSRRSFCITGTKMLIARNEILMLKKEPQGSEQSPLGKQRELHIDPNLVFGVVSGREMEEVIYSDINIQM